MKYINESQRSTPIIGEYEVVVAGGGIAGIAAALAAEDVAVVGALLMSVTTRSVSFFVTIWYVISS